MADERRLTVDEVKPFFNADGLLHLELALTRWHLNAALAAASSEGADDPD